MVGVVSRLVWQKGFDIVAGAWYDLLQRPMRMVVLGTGEHGVQEGLRALAGRAIPTRFARTSPTTTPSPTRSMAGSDLFLMPSRFEPCGLTQMYACATARRRSCAPRAGSWTRWSPGTRSAGRGTGFRFDNPDGTGLVWALDQALAALKDKKSRERLMKNGMARDFSWDRSAREYVDLYRRAMSRV